MDASQIGGPPPDHKILRDLAYSLIKMDQAYLSGLKVMSREEEFVSREYEVILTEETVKDVNLTLQTFTHIMSGNQTPSAAYLRDSSLARFWAQAMRKVHNYMCLPLEPANDGVQELTRRFIRTLDKSATETQIFVSRAFEAGLCGDEIEDSLRLRWLNLDSIHDTFSLSTHSKRTSQSW